MKKTYLSPFIETEDLNVNDIITASDESSEEPKRNIGQDNFSVGAASYGIFTK